MIDFLKPSEKEFLDKNMIVKEYKKGEQIYSPLQKCKYLSFVLSGSVRLAKYSGDGRVQIVAILKKGAFFGEALVFQELHYPVYVIADKDCKIGNITKDTLIKISSMNEKFMEVFLSEITTKIFILNNQIEILSLKTVKDKLIKFLYNQYELQKSSEFKLPYTKQKIANMIGTSREVVSRNFRELEDEGAFIYKGDKLALDLDYFNEKMYNFY
ncbi:Crp/Fnr family transcriptional regulator [Alkalithermobacter paradoxus]|uniref:Cyclic AMP receptor-like protein n=1 Tax=Alkalithermobacter paradoxus TaxID=29349 RepID=A0A1V4I8M4_9FIRM|nr:cyclic AMP receptor-like protein [[Clostridium] thermoalcaliphilum]